jgi:dinuclear metal center YbgI/SA1388 family protein
MANRGDIVRWCNDYLRASEWQDAAVNGLQVEGKTEINRVALAVSTSDFTLQQAIAMQADALLVHHGLLFGSRMQPLTGLFARRLRILFKHDINLIGYHLPLDGHEAVGNCVLLAEACRCPVVDRFALIGGGLLGAVGEPTSAMSLEDLTGIVAKVTEREPTVIDAGIGPEITRAAFLTGSGYSTLEDAIAAGCQVLVTGDVREPTMAEARELGIHVIAAGHEATERLGIQALGEQLASEFNIETRFIHDPNPV